MVAMVNSTSIQSEQVVNDSFGDTCDQDDFKQPTSHNNVRFIFHTCQVSIHMYIVAVNTIIPARNLL